MMARKWAMPNRDTFSVPAIGDFVRRYLAQSTVSIDPFARNNRWATHTNDLDPGTSAEHHLQAVEFLALLYHRGVRADLIIFDPPYSPRQIADCYLSAGLSVAQRDTQNARLYSECRALFNKLATPGCVALSFGWNSTGMGEGWKRLETLLVCHGSAHNDTICVADQLIAAEKAVGIATQPAKEDAR